MKISAIDRYFIALIPPEPLFTQIHQLKIYCSEAFGSKAALRSPPHLTLHMPFEWTSKKTEQLTKSVELLGTQLSPVHAAMKNFGSFPPRVIYVNVIESVDLRALQHRVAQFCKRELNLFNGNYQDQPFHPHFTIAFRDLKKDKFTFAWKEFETKSFEGEFLANTISLMKHDGSRWLEHLRFPMTT